MADMDYNPNPTFQVESVETNHELPSSQANPDGLSVKIPNSRGSESPTVNTPIVSS